MKVGKGKEGKEGMEEEGGESGRELGREWDNKGSIPTLLFPTSSSDCFL